MPDRRCLCRVRLRPLLLSSLTARAGSGSNVLTFSGAIASDASGTFSVSALSGSVKDLASNAFSGTVSKDFGISLDATYEWSLSGLNRLAANTYEIATKIDLYRLANIVNVNHNECSGITFLQTQNIVCDAGYTPIGYEGDNDHAYFRGTYDGQDHTVSGITVTRTGNTSTDKYINLFGCIYEGTVQNVVLANSTFTGYERVGGIAGYNSWGTVRNCRVESSVTIRVGYSVGDKFGGVAGYLHGQDALMIGGVSAATIDRNGLEFYQRGGIVGHVYGSTLKDCVYTGTSVTGTSNVGSIAGDKDGTTYRNNYYTAISLGGIGAPSGTADQDGARRARTITLGEGITLSGTETTYDVSGITAYGSTGIGYGGKIYSGAGQTLTLRYTGTVPAGYSVVYTVTRTSNGNDITANVLSGTTLTIPGYDVTVTATLRATSPYAVWAAASGVSGAWNETDALGIHNVFRYVFDKPAGAFTNPPLIDIAFASDGTALVLTPPLVNTTGFDFSLLATDDLAGANPATFPLDPGGTNAAPASSSSSRFFRLKAAEK